MGQHLALRVRTLMFRSILRQEVGWFDKPANSSGQLTAKLAENASSVRGAIGDVLGSVAQNLFCLAIGYGIALAYSWRIALVVTALLPVMVGTHSGRVELRADRVNCNRQLSWLSAAAPAPATTTQCTYKVKLNDSPIATFQLPC